MCLSYFLSLTFPHLPSGRDRRARQGAGRRAHGVPLEQLRAPVVLPQPVFLRPLGQPTEQERAHSGHAVALPQGHLPQPRPGECVVVC